MSLEVINAACSAQIHDRIRQFDDGYNTRVGERGNLLSGGEKLRIAIARQFLRNPDILLFDEADSALDSITKHEILRELLASFKGRTMIVIAHQLRTIAGANLILVMKGGEIVERGAHVELISLNGLYREMWEKQKTKKLWKSNI